MAAAPRYLIDTNILLRVSRPNDALFPLVGSTLDRLSRDGSETCYSLQNIAEFWNVSTRPLERNGFGLTIAETNQSVEYIERTMTFLPDNEQVYSIWRHLAVAHNVRGVQVHDARLAAIALTHGVPRILTLNQPDFLRYAGVEAVHPSEVHASGG